MGATKRTNDAYRLLKFIMVVLSGVFVGSLLSGKANGSDVVSINDLIPADEYGLVMGWVGDEYVELQRVGNQTVGNVGNKRVYMYQVETDGWKWTTGYVDDVTININEYKFSDELELDDLD